MYETPPLRLKLITPPKFEPVTVAEAKLHARIDETEDDTLVADLIATAREMAETYTRRVFVTQTWQALLDQFPRSNALELPKPPLFSVTHIKTYDDSDTPATLAPSNYFVDTATEPGRIVLRDAASSWPSVDRVANGVEIQFVAGYGQPSAVPNSIKQGILQILMHLYDNRGDASAQPPNSAYAALASERFWVS